MTIMRRVMIHCVMNILSKWAQLQNYLHLIFMFVCVLNCTSQNFVTNSWSPYLIKLRATDIDFIKFRFLFKNCKIIRYKKHWIVLYYFCHEQWWMHEKYENRPNLSVDLSSFLLLLYMCIHWGVCTVIDTLSHIRRRAVCPTSVWLKSPLSKYCFLRAVHQLGHGNT